MKRFALTIILAGLVCLIWSGIVYAQRLDPQSTEVPTPEVIIAQPGTTINLEQPAPLDAVPLGGINGIILVVGALALLVIGFGAALFRSGTNPDAAASVQIATLRHNEQVISELRAAYESSAAQTKTLVQALTTGFTLLAPLTGIKTDDEIAGLLKDISDPQAVVTALKALKAQQAAPPADPEAPGG